MCAFSFVLFRSSCEFSWSRDLSVFPLNWLLCLHLSGVSVLLCASLFFGVFEMWDRFLCMLSPPSVSYSFHWWWSHATTPAVLLLTNTPDQPLVCYYWKPLTLEAKGWGDTYKVIYKIWAPFTTFLWPVHLNSEGNETASLTDKMRSNTSG